MAKCFCGCGRRVGLFSVGLNRQGRKTAGLIEELRTTRGELEAYGRQRGRKDIGPVLREYDEMIDEGDRYARNWASLMHSYGTTPSSQDRAFMNDWAKWKRAARAHADARRLLPASADQ
ncbi:MAG: hypothetical protein WBM00_05695 [Solirubrobacterales bacterium]